KVLDDPPVIVDVSHNPLGVKALVESLRSPHVVVLAIAKDKDAAAMIHALSPLADPLILTRFTGERSMPAEALAAAAGGTTHEVIPSLDAAIDRGFKLASVDRPLLITGSFFTAGQARALLVERYGARPLAF
ncbi:MAG: hypothetical protein WD873_06785, partial [Candidatus Hydrogenedentales bacterium]